jgi:acyl-coenzyme A thioesterase PaaI-like protein
VPQAEDTPIMERSLQERFAPTSMCYGCGPANVDGLHVRSFPEGDVVVAEWMPSPHHLAFEGVMNGGVIGSILDCHCNWTAAWHLMRQQELDRPPATVTVEYAVKLRRPTPMGAPVRLVARPEETNVETVTVSAELWSGERVCATCIGRFMAVKPGHPAFHRW